MKELLVALILAASPHPARRAASLPVRQSVSRLLSSARPAAPPAAPGATVTLSIPIDLGNFTLTIPVDQILVNDDGQQFHVTGPLKIVPVAPTPVPTPTPTPTPGPGPIPPQPVVPTINGVYDIVNSEPISQGYSGMSYKILGANLPTSGTLRLVIAGQTAQVIPPWAPTVLVFALPTITTKATGAIILYQQQNGIWQPVATGPSFTLLPGTPPPGQ